MPELAEILDSFCRLDGVRGALVLDSEGEVQAERFSEAPDTAALARMVQGSLASGGRLSAVLGKGRVAQQYVEFSQAQVTADSLEGGRTLVVVADTGANLGRIRLEIRKNKKAVESSLP